jgi:hypothetical protein
MYPETVWVLPTATKINPAAPQSATYYDPDQVAYVMRRMDVPRTRPTCVATSFGTADGKIGDRWVFIHDQTGARLGEYEVVGIAIFKTGETIGEVPNANINHRVFK